MLDRAKNKAWLGGLLVGLGLLLGIAALGLNWPFARSGPIPTSPMVLTSPQPTKTSTYVGELVPTLVKSASPAVDTLPATPAPDQVLTPVDAHVRFGFGISSSAPALSWASRLGASWYLDWRAESESGIDLEHWKMVRVSQAGYTPTLVKIRRLAQSQTGRVWILGNEPDVIWQDNLPPEDYAKAYGELYQVIKTADPAAIIAVAGIAQATPLRLEYLDRVLEAYLALYGEAMPVDWWTVHGYVLREERNSWGVEIPPGFSVEQGNLYEITDHGRLDYFEAQLRDFRAWMAARGYRDKPLALTEFGILMPPEYGFPPEMVVQYLNDTFAMLLELSDPLTGYPLDENRLVQRWAWFSLTDPNYPTSNLGNLENEQLTLVGQAFRDFVQALNTP